MKSGTNWLGGLLNRHPEVRCRGEYHWQDMLGPLLERTAKMTALHDDDFRRFLIQQFRSVVKRAMVRDLPETIRFVGDRTPHTVQPLILKAPQIVIVRDGRDVLVSRAFHLFNRPDVTGLFAKSPRMAESLQAFREDKWFFKNHPERLLEERQLVVDTARWWVEQLQSDQRAVERYPQIPMHFVRYEALLQDAQGHSDRLFEFLGADPALAAPIAGQLTPGFEKEKPDQFFRKGEAGDWVNYFTDQTKAWFKEIAGEQLIAEGYAVDANW